MESMNSKPMNFPPVPMAILAFGIVSFVNVKIALFLLVALFYLFVAKAKPWTGLALFIIIGPLSNTELLDQRIGGIAGLEVLNLVLFSSMVIYLLSSSKFRISRGETIFILTIVFIHGVSFLRSLPNLLFINAYFGEQTGELKYFVSHFFKPTAYLIPFILIAGYVKRREDVYSYHKAIVFALLVLSVVVVSLYALKVPTYNHSSWEIVRATLGDHLGFHGNDIAIFYVLAYPFVLANFIHRKDLYATTCLVISLLAVALLYSRTAYVLILFSTVVMLMVEKSKKWLIIFTLTLAVFLSFSASTVSERFITGVEEGDVAVFSAGRMDSIWPAVMRNLRNNPSAVVFGQGRYSIIYAIAVEKGHPHNMYLEAILDAGVVGLLAFLACFAYVIKGLKRGIGRLGDEKMKLIATASLVSIVAYMISGVSGRHFFPNIINSTLWVVMALGLATVRAADAQEGRVTKKGEL